MARNYRFFVRNPGSTDLLQKKEATMSLSDNDEPEIFFQLVKVLRVKPGDTVRLLPGERRELPQEFVYEVIACSKKTIELRFLKVVPNNNELGFQLGLWLCIPNKPDKLELILQKAAEIGAANIVLFESEYTQMKHQLRIDRLRKIVLEAAEQSERALVPTMEISGQLQVYLRSADQAKLETVWVALERSDNPSKAVTPFSGASTSQGVRVLIGPEGGFSESEKQLFAELKIRTFSLGKRVLRMETAAILSLGMAALLDA